MHIWYDNDHKYHFFVHAAKKRAQKESNGVRCYFNWRMVADEFTFKFAAFVRIGQQLVKLSHRSSK
jgi:hypothetical protein